MSSLFILYNNGVFPAGLEISCFGTIAWHFSVKFAMDANFLEFLLNKLAALLNRSIQNHYDHVTEQQGSKVNMVSVYGDMPAMANRI